MVGKPVQVLTTGSSEPAIAENGICTPVGGTETALAEILADVVHADQVPAGSHFFDDLGADSMVMARFCARVRKRPDLPSVSIKDIYQHPTIASLAAAVAGTVPAPAAADPAVAAPAQAAHQASTRQYLTCGALQLLFFLGYAYVVALVGARAYDWIAAASGYGDIYLRSVLFGGVAFLVLCTLPVLVKWVLVGRWKPQQIPLWGLGYLRFWIVKTLIRSNPMVMFAGSPLYNLYLRALGAKVGKGAVIHSHHVPVCSDLLTVGAGSVIRKDAFFQCYRAHAGRIETGPVTLGRGVFIGEKSVLDISTSMGDEAQLGHASALYRGQAIPAGQRWHGSPAQRTELNYLRTGPARCGPMRKARYSAGSLLTLFFVYLPLLEGGIFLLLAAMPSLVKPLDPGMPSFSNLLDPSRNTLMSREFYLEALFFSLVFFCGAVLAGLLLVVTVPRLLNLFIKPDRVYPLYGLQYRLLRGIARMTGSKFFTYLFGDSSYIVYYLRWLGYDLGQVEQTGSNFGTEVGHETPFLSSIGSGTMIADGLAMVNADYSSTSFRVSRVSIGPRNFVGNNIVYPAGGRTGDNCLLATKAMIPLEGKIREGVGLLGSPSFEIPRSVERDSRFDDLRTGEELRRRLAAKNKYNLRTMALFLASRWLHVLLVSLCLLAAFALYGPLDHLVLAALFAVAILITPAYFVLVERGLRRFRPLEPRYCSIYDPYFWRHERLWKVPGNIYLHMFDGTPFKSLIWRLLGVQIGRRVFDDGCYLTERTLAAIGDDCTLNMGTKIQCHSQEDGTFKSDRSVLGAGCTLGVGAMVHYGVTMGDGAVLAADSFLMKGEEVPAGARWGGNPARELT
jgi:non-ribosomal peptide synthetase-like protein